MNRRDFLRTAAGAVLVSALPATPVALPSLHAEEDATQPSNPSPIARFLDTRDWFFQKRFGLFVHWGLYSIAAWHEQYQWRAKVPREQYAKLRDQWNPVRFDPEQWLDLLQSVGMKYICLTTKHHDGFCLWDTKLTDFNTMHTPYGKDVLKMLADACHRRGIPLCLYYSCVDWHQKNYPNQGRSHELPPQPGDEPDLGKYLQFVKGQVRELCTNYGQIHGFWWDMNVDKHQDPTINALIRKLQPAAVINNRGYDPGDFGTPERDYDSSGEELLRFTTLTEANQSVGSESWGYRKDEDYYTDAHLERSIDKYLARDANYLLNVGPMPSGVIGPNETAILQRIGKWYNAVRESVEDVEPCSQWIANRNVLLTRRHNTLYVHLHREPVVESVKLAPIDVAPARATLLNDGRPVEFAVELLPSEYVAQKKSLRLRKLPVNEMAGTVLVVKLEFDQLPDGGSDSVSHGAVQPPVR